MTPDQRLPLALRGKDLRTVREDCLEHLVNLGEAHLRHQLGEFVQHYNRERYHQGKGAELVMPNLLAVNDIGAVETIKNDQKTIKTWQHFVFLSLRGRVIASRR